MVTSDAPPMLITTVKKVRPVSSSPPSPSGWKIAESGETAKREGRGTGVRHRSTQVGRAAMCDGRMPPTRVRTYLSACHRTVHSKYAGDDSADCEASASGGGQDFESQQAVARLILAVD